MSVYARYLFYPAFLESCFSRKDWGPIRTLRTPEKAKIARERKLQTNPAGKSRSTRGQSDPKLSSWQRVQEHKNEYLTSVDGKLRCDTCKETISKMKSTVKKHISTLKHVTAKKTILESKKKDQSVLELFRRNDQAKRPKGETLPHDMRLYRFLVTTTTTTIYYDKRQITISNIQISENPVFEGVCLY